VLGGEPNSSCRVNRRRSAIFPDVTALGWPQVLAWRARRQHLSGRARRSAAFDVISDIAGLHAQLMTSAELTLWARVQGLEADAVARALWEERTLVKTWALRGTLHLLPTAELPLWVAAQGLLKPRHHTGAWQRYYGVTREQADAMLAAIPEALDGRMLTREELAAEVGRLTGIDVVADKLRSGFGEMLKPAAFRGDVCFAPSEGRSVRFVRPDQWLGRQSAVSGEEAARVVARRYLAAYGPANREAFARWFGITSPAQAGRWLAGLGEEAVTVEVDGAAGWMLAEHVEEALAAEPDGTVRLLPAFDQHVVAAPRDVEAVLSAEHRERVYRAQGWLSPVVLVGGRIAGVWSHERQGARLAVEVAPFGRLAAGARRGVEAEAEALAGFLGGRLELRWS
jgi:Winged helix DNA-binding domain